IAILCAEYLKDKAVLYSLDAFGPGLPSNSLKTDSLRRMGSSCTYYAPDIFEGDPAPNDLLVFLDFNIREWLVKHPPERALSIVRKVMEALREQGVIKFAGVGFCYGGRLGFEFAFTNEIIASSVAHPSLLQDGDLEVRRRAASYESRASLVIDSCDIDKQFLKERREGADEPFGDGRIAPGYQQAYWESCSSQTAQTDPKVKAGMEGAFKNTVKWFRKQL
ncbi:hypothetical protein BC834DRAFT_835185, partial [Gloeopeniophorella convolvens]